MSAPVLDVAIVSYGTDHLLLNLLRSIARVLPGEALGEVHVWDNASPDRSAEVLARLQPAMPALRVHRSPRNIQHGPALDRLLRDHARAEWVLLLDSDTEVRRDFRDHLPPLTAPVPAFVGQIHPEVGPLYAYLAHVLVHRPTYLQLPPFADDGAPGRDYFRAVAERGLPFTAFRWQDHVDHLGQGTLRALVERDERGNPLFAFAQREAQQPRSAERRSREEALRAQRDAFLAGAPEPALPAPPPATAPADAVRVHAYAPSSPPGWRARLTEAVPFGPWVLHRARRVGLVQKMPEIRALCRELRRDPPRRVLEIGTAYGGTLLLWTRIAAPDALVVSVDRPPWEPDDAGEAARVSLLGSFRRPRQTLTLVRGDSHRADTREAVARALGGEPLDFLFIDGDHSLDGVRADHADYTPLVRPGGLVAFHDVHPHSRGFGGDVPRFWTEIAGRSTRLLLADVRQDGFGIGLLRC